MYKIIDDEVKIDTLIKEVADEAAGAIVTFLGVTRGIEGDKRVSYLDYDAYKEMAEDKLKEIGEETKKKFDICHISVVHRVGKLGVGEASVGIAVSSPHRAEGFEACKYIMDRIKEIAPIWKKEVWNGGEKWKGKE
ncbi:MAG: molybdenum cofactor biosynthesis protein MoaE [Candidatus Schekmanbacteria bacterium]|nr:molybdenum cofactor biosynthesis protein MoaE [Candidatus Schekmanbacteria bacterium]